MKRLLNCAFIAVALLIAATAAWRSHVPATRSSVTTGAATARPQSPNAAQREFAATGAPKPVPEIRKHAPHAGLVLRLKVPNTGAMVELSSKFGAFPGEAVDLILEADSQGLVVEGISFHVGSQTTNFENYVQALSLTANIFQEAKDRGYHKMNLVDIGGGFPAPYDASVKPFKLKCAPNQPASRCQRSKAPPKADTSTTCARSFWMN